MPVTVKQLQTLYNELLEGYWKWRICYILKTRVLARILKQGVHSDQPGVWGPQGPSRSGQSIAVYRFVIIFKPLAVQFKLAKHT